MKDVGRPENQLCVERLLSASIPFAPRDSYISGRLLRVCSLSAVFLPSEQDSPWALRNSPGGLEDRATSPTSQLHLQIMVLTFPRHSSRCSNTVFKMKGILGKEHTSLHLPKAAAGEGG